MTDQVSSGDTGDGNPARILVVDGNVMSRALIERRLIRDGYTIVAASSGDEALSAVADDPVDLIFLDLVMPGMGGMEVLKTLKADERYRHIPVVVISGVEDANAADDVKAAGAVDFLHKPVKAANLIEIVSDLLGSAPAAFTPPTPPAEALESVSNPEDSPVFDPAIIKQMIKDYGTKTAAGFITQFEELAPAQKDALNAARNSGDRREWSRAAHDLKGGARTMGLGPSGGDLPKYRTDLQRRAHGGRRHIQRRHERTSGRCLEIIAGLRGNNVDHFAGQGWL